MGNQTSTSTSGTVDVTKLYSVETNVVDSSEEYGGFSLLRGKRKRDQFPVLVLRCEKSKTTSAGVCSNALRQAKKLRHPLLLNLLDGMETETDIFLVVEDATPLSLILRTSTLSHEQRCWGLRCLGGVLTFLNEKLKLVHGNITPFTVFVTPGGDWKLFGLELLDTESAGDNNQCRLPPLLKQAQWIPSSQYKSPERRKNDWQSMEASPYWNLDSYSLGVLILDTFQLSQSRLDALRECDKLISPSSSNLAQITKQLLSADPKARLCPSGFLRADYFTNDLFVKSSLFLEELQLKTPEKKELFFASLVENCPRFPVGALQFKILPLIAHAISIESKAVHDKNVAAASGQPPPSPASVNVLLGMLDALLKCDECVGNPTGGNVSVDKAIVDLFSCNDRVVRVGLLERIQKLAKSSLGNDAINACFDQIGTGFLDSTPKIRELTIKATVYIAPKLNAQNLNDKLLRHIAALQGDAVPEIRANSAMLLGAIAPLLSNDARKKMLTASFARAMKDAYVPSRVGGLRGLISTHKMMGLDAGTLAAKILPTICPMLVDSNSEVRSLAYEAMHTLLKTLKEMEQVTITNQASASAGSSATDSANNASSTSGMLNMAVNFFTSSATAAVAAATSSSTPAISAAPPPPSSTASLPPSFKAVQKPPPASSTWEDADDDALFKEEDDDDFFSKTNKTTTATNKKAQEDDEDDFFKPAVVAPAKSRTLKMEPPGQKQDLSEADLDMFNFDPQPPKPVTTKPKSLGATKTTQKMSKEEDDFFNSILSAPPKRKG